MSNPDQYHYGQGRLLLAIIAANGTTGPWRWVGDVSALSGAFAEETVSARESWSGSKSKVREFNISKDMTWSATLHSLVSENLALFTDGTATEIAAGTVTGEVLPSGLVAGDIVALQNIGISDLVITDSAGTPVTLDPQHYTLAANTGSIEIVSLPTSPAPTQPFKAAYTHAAASQVAFLKAAARPNVALRYEGINLAENGAAVVVELYKLSPSLLQELSLIADGTDVLGMPVSFSSLRDTRQSATGAFGQFGRILQGVAA